MPNHRFSQTRDTAKAEGVSFFGAKLFMKRLCEQCDGELKSYQRRFCSRGCYHQWRRENLSRAVVLKRCQWCECEFEILADLARRGQGKFCSQGCYGRWFSANKTGKDNPHWSRVLKECEWCGREFEVKLAYSAERRFCSRCCYGRWYSENLKGENNPGWKGRKVEARCLWCNTKFWVKMWHIDRGFGKFCSRACAGRWRSEHFSGENSWAWRGGISFSPYAPEFNKALKRRVRERDRYECGICGNYGVAVHHIDYDKSNNSLSNLITLCDHCHGRTGWQRKFWQTILSFVVKGRKECLDGNCV